MTDERLEEIVGTLLRVGVIVSAAVMIAGGAWYLAIEGMSAPHYGAFRPDVRGARSLASLPAPEAVMLGGLLLLIATPVARVVFTLAAFLYSRDRIYVAITLVVLIVLLFSIGTSWL
jgi:uncharacterized membrane protein